MGEGVALEGVSFSRGALVIVDEQSLHVPKGGALVISGANGVGKSTLLLLCAGLLEPSAGSATLNGFPSYQQRPSELMRNGIKRAVVFQHGGLVAHLSALENVKLPMRYHADLLQLDETAIHDRARKHLRRMGIYSPDTQALPGSLSLGVRKRVAFARTLALEPDFVFFDDPDAGLDSQNAERVMELLLLCKANPDVTMICASNHRVLIERLAVPVMELAYGRLTRPDLLSAPPASLV